MKRPIPRLKTVFSAKVSDGKVKFSTSNRNEQNLLLCRQGRCDPRFLLLPQIKARLWCRAPTPVVVTVEVSDDPALDLDGATYAYIFGYEPVFTTTKDADGKTVSAVDIKMGMDDPVTREQVAAMLTRMIDQAFHLENVDYPVTANISAFEGAWYERGLAYINAKGGFSGLGNVPTARLPEARWQS
jgi:hypothetical protein